MYHIYYYQKLLKNYQIIENVQIYHYYYFHVVQVNACKIKDFPGMENHRKLIFLQLLEKK